MLKILTVFEGKQIDVSMVDFAYYIASLTHSKLTGVFFGTTEEKTSSSNDIQDIPSKDNVAVKLQAFETLQKLRTDNIRLFKEACANRRIRSEVIHCPATRPAQKVISKSRFADLLILKAETSFEKEYEGTPTNFVKEVLAGAECPVLIAPLSFEGFEEIIFAYDGSRSSVFAIKQFAYLFPELSDKKVVLLEVRKDGELLTEKEKIGSLLKMHYSSIGFQVLHGRAEDELFKFLFPKKKSLVVMGAFGRGILSELFKRSTARLVIKTINCPFFIAHY